MALWSMRSFRITPSQINHVLIHALKHGFPVKLFIKYYVPIASFVLLHSMSGVLLIFLKRRFVLKVLKVAIKYDFSGPAQ